MTSPERRECEWAGYPNRDTRGDVMYTNTHFATEAEAWESLKASVEAGVCLAGYRVANCEAELLCAQKQAADAAREYAVAMDGYRARRRQKNG